MMDSAAGDAVGVEPQVDVVVSPTGPTAAADGAHHDGVACIDVPTTATASPDEASTDGPKRTVASDTVLIKGLPRQIRSRNALTNALSSRLSTFGRIVEIRTYPRSESRRGLAWVDFKSTNAANACAAAFNGAIFLGQTVTAMVATPSHRALTAAGEALPEKTVRPAKRTRSPTGPGAARPAKRVAGMDESPPSDRLLVRGFDPAADPGLVANAVKEALGAFSGFGRVNVLPSRGVAVVFFADVKTATAARDAVGTIPICGTDAVVVFAPPRA